MEKTVITVVGKDGVGIIAKVCNYLASNNVNILDISQTITGGFFNMMMVVDPAGSSKDIALLSSELKQIGEEIGVVIQAQNERIFDIMHRIQWGGIMINLNEVFETNKMIHEMNLDVRTITIGISLLDCVGATLEEVKENIYNKITKKDVTKGLKIAGTGEIDKDGNIGTIGGVKYKLLGAEKKHADIFLVPNGENYKECIKIKKERNLKIKVIGVSTFSEAVDKLNRINA